jgi:hypothetical protein
MAPGQGAQSIGTFLTQVGQEKSGFLAAGVVVVVCAVLSAAGWYPLSLPSRLIREILPDWDCVGKTPKTTEMYVCSVKVGALQIVGPLAMMAVVFVFRAWLKAWLDRMSPSLPNEARFLFAPAIATLAFTIAWAGLHYKTTGQSGILPQVMFPALVGLFTYSVARWGPGLQRSLAGFFDFRDAFPVPIRLVAVIAVPALLAYLITNQERVSDTALKEQFVVLDALAMGFLMMAPRSGDALTGMGQTLTQARSR